MKPEDALTIMKQAAPSATIQDATAFLALCSDRGLSPFVEASPIIADYNSRNGPVHSLGIKEHYSVQERWANQSGGYTVSRSEVVPHEGGLRARVWIISNRDYAAVGKMAAMIPSLNFREELARFEVCGEATVTANEIKRRAPATKTWEWVAEKRAREGALRQKFGKEPSQSRQMYANALQVNLAEATQALYGVEIQPRPALTAQPPAEVEAEYVEALQDEQSEAMYPEAMEEAPEPHWTTDDDTVARFTSWTESQGLRIKDIEVALGVDAIVDYTGTKAEAMAALKSYIARNRDGGTDEDPERPF